MSDQIFFCVKGGQRDYAHHAVNQAVHSGALTATAHCGALADGPVTHWYGGAIATKRFLPFAELIMTAMYPQALANKPDNYTIIMEDAFGVAMVAMGLGKLELNGVYTEVQTVEQFLAKMSLVRVEGTLSGDQPADAAIAVVELGEPYTSTPELNIPILERQALEARLTDAQAAFMGQLNIHQVSAMFEIGLTQAEAMVRVFGSGAA